MGMRETERSARIYFFVAGGLGVAYGLVSLVHLAGTSATALRHEPVAAIWYLDVASVVFSLLFVIAGIDLPRTLRTGATWIRRMLVAAGASLVLWVPLLYLSSDFRYDPDGAKTQAVGGIVGIAIPLAIVIYLYVNLRRLSAAGRAHTTGSVP
jgi:hypothetical protein